MTGGEEGELLFMRPITPQIWQASLALRLHSQDQKERMSTDPLHYINVGHRRSSLDNSGYVTYRYTT
jgi:hypothetical protein